MEAMEIEKKDVEMTIYTLQSLCLKGISIPETVRMSLQNLVQWYEFTKDSKYIQTALIQICALSEMGMMQEEDAALYNKVCRCAGWGEMECWNYRLYMVKKIKVNKAQVKALIRRWMPSHDNPMTIGEVVDDIIDKVKKQKTGHYYYCYEKKARRGNASDKDIYKLIVESDHSFLWDLKYFKCYTFLK